MHSLVGRPRLEGRSRGGVRLLCSHLGFLIRTLEEKPCFRSDVSETREHRGYSKSHVSRGHGTPGLHASAHSTAPTPLLWDSVTVRSFCLGCPAVPPAEQGHMYVSATALQRLRNHNAVPPKPSHMPLVS